MAVFSPRIAGGMYQYVEQTSGSGLTVDSWRYVPCVEQNSGSVLTVESWSYVPMCGADQWQWSHGG